MDSIQKAAFTGNLYSNTVVSNMDAVVVRSRIDLDETDAFAEGGRDSAANPASESGHFTEPRCKTSGRLRTFIPQRFVNKET